MSMRWKHDYIIKQIDVLKLLRSDADYLLAFPHQRALGAVLAADNVALALGRDEAAAYNGSFTDWTGVAPNDTLDLWTNVSNGDATSNVTENPAGQCQFISDGTNAQIFKAVLVVGKTYRATIDVTAQTLGGISWGDNAGPAVGPNSVGNDQTLEFTATSVNFTILRTAACNITVDNLRIQQTGILDSGDYPGAELYVTANAASDPAGNEANATTGWAARSNALLTSDSTIKSVGDYSIKWVSTEATSGISFDTDALSLTIGKRYKITFRYRHLGSGDQQRISLSSTTSANDNLLASFVNTLTTFTEYKGEYTHSATTRYLIGIEASGSNDGGGYIDNISITEANPIDGDDTGTEPGVPMGSYYSKTDDGATSFSALGLTEYNSMINLELFHIGIGIQKAVWDTTERYFISHIIDADNWIKIGGTTTAGQLVYEIRAGGVTEQVLYASGSPTGIIMPSISSKGGVMKAWLGRTQVGGDVSIANTLAGNFASMTIGAENGTPLKVNLANRNWYWHMSDEKTTAELERIAKGIGAAL